MKEGIMKISSELEGVDVKTVVHGAVEIKDLHHYLALSSIKTIPITPSNEELLHEGGHHFDHTTYYHPVHLHDEGAGRRGHGVRHPKHHPYFVHQHHHELVVENNTVAV